MNNINWSKYFFITFLLFSLSSSAYGDINRPTCKDIQKITIKAVEKAINKGCGYVATEFDGACISITGAETGGTSAIPCTIGSSILGYNCKSHGKKYVHKNAENIGKDLCDIMFPDRAPYIFVENHLKNHKVDFRVVIKAGDDIHLHGNNWLDAGESGILASNKLDKKHYSVKVRVKRDMKKDKEYTIKNVRPKLDTVYIYHKDKHYHVAKKDNHKKPMIAIENHLKKHKVDFRVVIPGTTDVHLPGNNWIKGGEKRILASYKLAAESYTLKARIKRDMKKDITLSIHHIHPGKDAVYIYSKNGKYHLSKKEINYNTK